jgi:hypothetical protein
VAKRRQWSHTVANDLRYCRAWIVSHRERPTSRTRKLKTQSAARCPAAENGRSTSRARMEPRLRGRMDRTGPRRAAGPCGSRRQCSRMARSQLKAQSFLRDRSGAELLPDPGALSANSSSSGTMLAQSQVRRGRDFVHHSHESEPEYQTLNFTAALRIFLLGGAMDGLPPTS